MKSKLQPCLLNGLLVAITFVAAAFSAALHDSQVMADEDLNTHSQQAVLVELFTSEGCSSCPPADANLRRLSKLAKDRGYPIYTLSYHVDYWNDLGWKDRFSSSAATNRQRKYSTVFQLNQIYTPQFVVNGQWEFVGSNRNHTRKAVVQALQNQVSAQLTVNAKSDGSNIQVVVATSGTTEADRLVIALVQASAESSVTKGENSGRTLDHIHIVRDFREVAVKDATQFRFAKPEDFTQASFHILAYLQSASHLRLMGITKAEIKGTETTKNDPPDS